ncbi:LysM peptidoglycan-binding domain-containing protein [Dyella sp. BiH032]|uniref:LysM peptidoglycan-binding domain-containing protein n=1 Tax=Dyella sp. BiH032 TaxID=3075430 RepID=UPI00289338FA|nr:LysM peptidoglycan-binding domain-containing protein [Dyella sp. BiH032]WNL46593.1 LysM peptidoglycan-binding domain-containing protein [Dyella sp. BiH032]
MTAVSAVRSSSAVTASNDAPTTYTVQHGDTLSGIAQRFGVSLAALEAANPQIANPDRIYPGDRIHLPAGGQDGGPQASAPAAGAPPAGKGGPASGFSISQNGVQMIEGFEGYSATAYPDPGTGGAPWTIGYGHTKGVQPGQTITRAQAEAYLKEDLAWAQDAVRRNVHVPINQNQFDALVSLTYNLGANGYPGLLAKLNAGDYKGAQQMFGEYVHAGGRVLQGLVNRRAKEAALFGSDAPSGTSTTPSPPSPPPSGGSRGGSYTVQPGDTLSAIAARQGVSLKALEAANPQIRDFNHIYPGQVIHLPGSSGSSSGSPAGGSYTVRSGDTMSGIAARHGVSLSALLAANPQIANPNRIYPGQVIHLPGGSGGNSAPASTSHDYTVRSGDTLSGIAARNGVSLAALERANPQISHPDRIYPGQVIHIPGSGGAKGTGGVQGTSGTSASGGKAVDIARQFLGRNASELKRSGALPMNPNVPSDVCCANFVSAVLQKAGLLDRHTDLVSGSSRTGLGAAGSIGRILKERGWKVVDAAHAKPGDVCILNNGGHVELVASNDHGNIQLIGSNNTNRDGTQRVGYGHPYGGAWYLTPP